MSHFRFYVPHVMCQVSRVTCHVQRVAFHLSLTPTTIATDPALDNSPIMQCMLVCKDPKTKKMSKHKNHQSGKKQKFLEVYQFSITPLTRSLQSTWKGGFHDGTHSQKTGGHCKFFSIPWVSGTEAIKHLKTL